MRTLLKRAMPLIAAIVLVGFSSTPGVAANAAPTMKSPQVTHTGRGPTGYTVTFRYFDPKATSVQIKGEWYFSSPDQTTTSTSLGLLPSQWRPGDFPIAFPNSPAANWPVISMTNVHKMTKDADTGVWSYTTPLPSGTFTYGFFVDCTSPTQTGCTEVYDPSNPAWNVHHGVSVGSVEPTSQVYVPSDPRFATVNYWWQAPAQHRGSLADVSYSSPQSTDPVGTHPLAVYLPPGYDPNRSTPYPTLYLSHGYGGNEVDWTTQGAAANILDNLIDTGQIQPMVVVMTDFNGFPGDCLSNPDPWIAAYDADLTGNVIPYVQSHYKVSTNVSQRAFAGLSCGGGLANSLMYNYTSEFGYFGVMSPYPGVATPTSSQISALQKDGILVGGGWQDPIHSFAASEVTTLQGSGVGVFSDFANAGHEWYIWRILFYDFLTRVAFYPVLG
jgi:enterochelin esterase-like enzyme